MTSGTSPSPPIPSAGGNPSAENHPPAGRAPDDLRPGDLPTRARPTRGRRVAALVAAVGVLAAALALLVAPAPWRLDDTRDGNAALAARVADVVGDQRDGYRGLSVAFVDRSGTRTAAVGDLGGGPLFEIGSVTKVLTGMLLADLIADGTVRADEPLSAFFPRVRFSDPAVGDVTLAELASHRSGLPRLGGLGTDAASGASRVLASGWANLRGANPYGESVDDLLREAAATSVGAGRGEVHYSNLGMALLGQALAARAGTTYPELVTARLLGPLGMSATTLTGSPDGSASGSTASGRPVDAWAGAGYAPAGIGPRSDAADLAALVTAVLDGSAPGASAATPRWADTSATREGERRIGYAWFVDRTDGREITWHNGGTGGFRSYVGFDRTAGQGVVVLGNTDRDVDWIGRRLLDRDAEPSGTGAGWWMVPVTLALALMILVSLPALAVTRAGTATRWASAPDRLRVVSSTLSTVAVALVAHRLGDWLAVPPPLWAAAVGAAAAGLALLVLRWRELDLVTGTTWWRWTGSVASVLASLVVIGALLAIR